jgi:hypothetical protein
LDIQGEYKIALAQEEVWKALNDAEVLKQCIPGCQEMEKKSDTEYSARVVAAIGPVKATFKTIIEMKNLKPPHSYTISGEANGGVAGFGNGSADITLTESAGTTTLHYHAKFKVGGKLAQIGARLVAGVTRKIADEFFSKFSQALDKGAEKVLTEQDKTDLERTAEYTRIILSIVVVVAVILIVLLLFPHN